MLQACVPQYRVQYVGPDEEYDVSAAILATAAIYVQPGGNDDLAQDWRHMKKHADEIRAFVHAGGRYMGSCTGGYMAGLNPWAGHDVGYALFPGTTAEYITSKGADIHTTRDTAVNVKWPSVWGDTPQPIYFQDGPYFRIAHGADGVTPIARFAANDVVAALVARYGDGKIGIQGPHTEAPEGWFTFNHVPGHADFTPGCDLIAQTLAP
jgi:glutamine amidotransferase-like uncharacterized protein